MGNGFVGSVLTLRWSCCGALFVGKMYTSVESKNYSSSHVHGIGRVTAWSHNSYLWDGLWRKLILEVSGRCA